MARGIAQQFPSHVECLDDAAREKQAKFTGLTGVSRGRVTQNLFDPCPVLRVNRGEEVHEAGFGAGRIGLKDAMHFLGPI